MRHIVYSALIKKNLMAGIPRSFFMVTGAVVLIGWNLTQNVLWGLVWGVISLAVGWVLAKFDPDFMDIFIAKYIRLFTTQNPHRHTGNHYYS